MYVKFHDVILEATACLLNLATPDETEGSSHHQRFILIKPDCQLLQEIMHLVVYRIDETPAYLARHKTKQSVYSYWLWCAGRSSRRTMRTARGSGCDTAENVAP